MSFFACTYVYAAAEEQAKYRPDHRAYLGHLLEEGKLAVSGPFVTDQDPGALLIFRAQSVKEVEEFVAADPMNLGGAVLSYSIHGWNPVLGSVGANTEPASS